MTTATQVIDSFAQPGKAREAVLFKADDGFKLVIMLGDKHAAIDITGAAARNFKRAWEALDADFAKSFLFANT